MILYHGSTLVVDSPHVITAEYGRDFGAGFYTTDIKDQAVRWAIRKAKIAARARALSCLRYTGYEEAPNA